MQAKKRHLVIKTHQAHERVEKEVLDPMVFKNEHIERLEPMTSRPRMKRTSPRPCLHGSEPLGHIPVSGVLERPRRHGL